MEKEAAEIMVGENRETAGNPCINESVVRAIAGDIAIERPDLVLVTGDLVNGWFRIWLFDDDLRPQDLRAPTLLQDFQSVRKCPCHFARTRFLIASLESRGCIASRRTS